MPSGMNSNNNGAESVANNNIDGNLNVEGNTQDKHQNNNNNDTAKVTQSQGDSDSNAEIKSPTLQ